MSNLFAITSPIILCLAALLIWQVYQDNLQWEGLIRECTISTRNMEGLRTNVSDLRNVMVTTDAYQNSIARLADGINTLQNQISILTSTMMTKSEAEKELEGLEKEMIMQRKRIYAIEVKYLQAIRETVKNE